jgi:hypothetical protein
MRGGGFCIIAFLAFLSPVWSASVTQRTDGPCSPAVADVKGNVTIVCEGVDPDVSKEVISLLNEILKDRKKLDQVMEGLDKIGKRIDPFVQPIVAATATVELLIKSDLQERAEMDGAAGFFSLASGKDSLLLTVGKQAIVYQQGNGTVLYRGVWSMDAKDTAAGKPVHSLRSAKYALILMRFMPEGSLVLNGSVRLTLNNSIHLDFAVPRQVAQKRNVFIRDISETLSRLAPANEPG